MKPHKTWLQRLAHQLALWLLRYSGHLITIERMIAIQGLDGNWDVNEYMTGYYNGMILINATLQDGSPIFRNVQVKEVQQDDSGWANPPSGRDIGLFDLPAADEG